MLNLTNIEWTLFSVILLVFLFTCYQHLRTKELYRMVHAIQSHLEKPLGEVSKKLIEIWKNKLETLSDNDPDRSLYMERLKDVEKENGN